MRTNLDVVADIFTTAKELARTENSIAAGHGKAQHNHLIVISSNLL